MAILLSYENRNVHESICATLNKHEGSLVMTYIKGGTCLGFLSARLDCETIKRDPRGSHKELPQRLVKTAREGSRFMGFVIRCVILKSRKVSQPEFRHNRQCLWNTLISCYKHRREFIIPVIDPPALKVNLHCNFHDLRFVINHIKYINTLSKEEDSTRNDIFDKHDVFTSKQISRNWIAVCKKLMAFTTASNCNYCLNQSTTKNKNYAIQ